MSLSAYRKLELMSNTLFQYTRWEIIFTPEVQDRAVALLADIHVELQKPGYSVDKATAASFKRRYVAIMRAWSLSFGRHDFLTNPLGD